LKKFYAKYPAHMARFRTHIENTGQQDMDFTDTVKAFLTAREYKGHSGAGVDDNILTHTGFTDRTNLIETTAIQ